MRLGRAAASSERRTVIVVEDEEDVRVAIRATLSRDPRLVVRGEAPDASAGVDLARALQPDAVILDHLLPGDELGLAAAPQFKDAAPGCKVLLFSVLDLQGPARRAAGVDAFVNKGEWRLLLPFVERLVGLPGVS